MRFTILTPSYNRAHTLPQLFRSLCTQTFRDFEWIIVDDGSTDGSRELISSWKADFPIRYHWKPNAGKHTAVNFGVQQAHGDITFVVDSDDRCLPQSLERFDYHWCRLPSPNFVSVGARCSQQDGTTLGPEFTKEYVDTFNLRQFFRLTDCDRCSVYSTDVLRQFPYPIFPGEKFITEGVVWNRILSRYACRFVNESLKIAGYTAGGLSSQGDLRPTNPRGAVLYYRELATHPGVPLPLRLKSAANALRFSFKALH